MVYRFLVASLTLVSLIAFSVTMGAQNVQTPSWGLAPVFSLKGTLSLLGERDLGLIVGGIGLLQDAAPRLRAELGLCNDRHLGLFYDQWRVCQLSLDLLLEESDLFLGIAIRHHRYKPGLYLHHFVMVKARAGIAIPFFFSGLTGEAALECGIPLDPLGLYSHPMINVTAVLGLTYMLW